MFQIYKQFHLNFPISLFNGKFANLLGSWHFITNLWLMGFYGDSWYFMEIFSLMAIIFCKFKFLNTLPVILVSRDYLVVIETSAKYNNLIQLVLEDFMTFADLLLLSLYRKCKNLYKRYILFIFFVKNLLP